jgi:uncharacterized repeat protein (TIGR03803 family)
LRQSLLAIFAGGLFLAATTSASAQTETILHTFALQNGDGASPNSPLAADSSGSLYGVTYSGGANGVNGKGVAYKLTKSSGGTWHETILHSFSGGTDGGTPGGHLVIDGAAKSIYGTAAIGGTNNNGIVYSLSPGNPWTLTAIYNFRGSEGSNPSTGVTLHGGNLYGTANGGTNGVGSVYRLHPPSVTGGQWHEQTLYEFTFGADGGYPFSTPIFDAAGNLYGSAFNSLSGAGTVYELSPPTGGSGTWTFNTLYTFSGGADGGSPGGLVMDNAGALYGTTQAGGANNWGTVFKLTPPSGGTGAWNESVLYSFTDGADGAIPWGGVIFDSAGNLYGTASGGGLSCGCGTVFEVSPGSGGTWTESGLYAFAGGVSDGYSPLVAPLLLNGIFYGTTQDGGGTGKYGIVYEITP